ncbi:MAG: hypothetical protein FH749_01200 [Firmicutes bacterium]|nr:hypothetical protein [Bacillota bacterium]
MAEMQTAIKDVVEKCKIYWMFSNLPRKALLEMELELQGHLEEAIADGKALEDVVGRDVIAFARTWAETNYRARTWQEKIFNLFYLVLLAFMVTLPFNHITFMAWAVPVYWSNLLIIAIITCLVAFLVQPGVIARIFALDSAVKQWLIFFAVFMLTTLAFVGLLLIPHHFEHQPLFYWPWQATVATAVVTFIVARVAIGKETRETEAAEHMVHEQVAERPGGGHCLLILPAIGLIGSGTVWWFVGETAKQIAQMVFVCSALVLWTRIIIWPALQRSRKK